MSVFVYLYKHIFCLIVLSFQFLFFYFSACKRIYVNMSDTNMKFDVFATLLILNGSEQSITTKQRHFICILHRCWIQMLYMWVFENIIHECSVCIRAGSFIFFTFWLLHEKIFFWFFVPLVRVKRMFGALCFSYVFYIYLCSWTEKERNIYGNTK